MSGVDFSALHNVFPAELLKYFSIVSSGVKTDEPTGEEYLDVVFEEKNELPEGFSRDAFESKGFFSKRVQDFPLRGRAVFLELRRRRWRYKVTGEQITRDFTFLAEGVAFTAELADFLNREVDSRLDPIATVAYYYKVKSRKARRCYILQKDGFASWDQASHAQEYMVFPKNTTTCLAIDESSLSQGDLNTFVSSRDTAGRKGKLVAVVSSTRSEKIQECFIEFQKATRVG